MQTVKINKIVLIAGFMIMGIFLFVLNFYTPQDSSKIRIIGCDIGQGDAILIVQGKNQILVDGGPNNKVLDCLANHLPISDRKIELVILTHPQYDHYRGLLDVFERYEIEYFLASGLDSDAVTYSEFEKLVEIENTNLLRPSKGLKVQIGDMSLAIIHPSIEFQSANSQNYSADTQVLGTYDTNADPNAFSVAGILSFGNFDVFLTGDLGPAESDALVDQGLVQDIELLKVQHHGSKNGLSQSFLNAAKPELAIISAGENNRFGHPHDEIINMLKGIKILRTDTDGEIIIVSDGENVWVEE